MVGLSALVPSAASDVVVMKDSVVTEDTSEKLWTADSVHRPANNFMIEAYVTAATASAGRASINPEAVKIYNASDLRNLEFVFMLRLRKRSRFIFSYQTRSEQCRFFMLTHFFAKIGVYTTTLGVQGGAGVLSFMALGLTEKGAT